MNWRFWKKQEIQEPQEPQEPEYRGYFDTVNSPDNVVTEWPFEVGY